MRCSPLFRRTHAPPALTWQRSSKRSRGFTLIELMVVVIILAILAGTVVQQFGGTAHDTRVSRAQADIKNFEGALERYFLKMDRYPSSEEGLEALVRPPTESGRNWGGPYVREIVPDPWNHPYRYRSPGSRPERPYELWSCGADGVDGGEGVNQDIKNWREDY